MRIGAVVLSRFSSSRLPGKALLEINNKPILLYIIERLLCVFEKEDIVIATSTLSSDDQIEAFAQQHGISCYRGSLNNVSQRFIKAAKSINIEYAIRINGDNIFIDVNVLKDMVQVTEGNKFLFVSNVKERTFPKGMSIEIVLVSHYEELLERIYKSDRYKEHVTLYLYEHILDEYYFYYNTFVPEASGIQLAIDTKIDFERTKKIISKFTLPHWKYNLIEIIQIMKDNYYG